MVTLTADIMFVNQIPFIITYGGVVGLTTVEWIPNRTGQKLADNCFTIQTILVNGI